VILARGWLRFPLRSFARPALAVFGVALGVAVAVSVDLAGEASLRSFRRSVEALSGAATHRIAGGPAGLDEALWIRLRTEGGVADAAPVVEGTVEIPPPSGEGGAGRQPVAVTLLGVDPFSEGPFRSFFPPPGRIRGGSSREGAAARDLVRTLLLTPSSVAGTREALARLPVRAAPFPAAAGAPADRLVVRAGGGDRTLVVAGLLEPGDEAVREGLSSVLVADVASAQEILGREGRLDRIDLKVPPGKEGEALLDRIRRLLPPGASIEPAGGRAEELERMTAAFRENLSAFGFLALLVGALLVHNTLSFAVLSRRETIGLLRALGATRREVALLVLAEGLAVGAAGTFAGIVAGNALARTILAHVAGTLNDLYAATDAREVPLLPLSIAKGAFLGLGVSLASALLPALEASGTLPREVLSRSRLEERFRRRLPLLSLAGAFLLAGGWWWLSTGRGGTTGGYAALAAVVAGYALLVPASLLLLCRGAAPLLRLLPVRTPFLAVRAAGGSLTRTGVAAAALVVALSAAVGVGVMVGSFREALAGWLGRTLHADLFVASPGVARTSGREPLPADLPGRLAALPGTEALSTVRRLPAESAGAPAELFVALLPPGRDDAFDLVGGRGAPSFRAFRDGGALFVSEPLAVKGGIRPGDSVPLRTEAGVRSFPVEAVYRDYGSDRGVIAMSRETFDRHWSDRSVDAVGIYLRDPSKGAELLGRVRRLCAGTGAEVRSNAELRRLSLAVFDRTFAVTSVLRLLVLLVAFAGVTGALLALAVERAGERALLRALGATGGQIFSMVLGEALVLGVFSGLLALPLGLLQGAALVKAILLRSFGWTIPLVVPAGTVLSALLPAAAASLLSGLAPALSSARELPAPALREE
jgi:putative ABC transport system permease protein